MKLEEPPSLLSRMRRVHELACPKCYYRSRKRRTRIKHKPNNNNNNNNNKISCACGCCGRTLDRYDSHGRPRQYILGHNISMSKAWTRSANTKKGYDYGGRHWTQK